MSAQSVDPNHWLYRLTSGQWLAAAQNERSHAQAAQERREHRKAMAHARRAAGMAMNAVLVVQPHEAWGRSYMEHVQALAKAPDAPDPVRTAAQHLVEVPLGAPPLVAIGGGPVDDGTLAAVDVILRWSQLQTSG